MNYVGYRVHDISTCNSVLYRGWPYCGEMMHIIELLKVEHREL